MMKVTTVGNVTDANADVMVFSSAVVDASVAVNTPLASVLPESGTKVLALPVL